MNIKEKVVSELREMKSQNPGCSPNVIYLGRVEYNKLRFEYYNANHYQPANQLNKKLKDYMKIQGLKIVVVDEDSHFFIPIN